MSFLEHFYSPKDLLLLRKAFYVYEMDHKTDEIEWDFQNHEASGMAGDVRVLYTSFIKKSNVTPSLERRIYICPG